MLFCTLSEHEHLQYWYYTIHFFNVSVIYNSKSEEFYSKNDGTV